MLSGWLLGLALGARHALDPDHLAAVSTLVARSRGPRGAALLGACWGAGHAFTLVIVAGTLLVLRTSVPDRIGVVAELIVAGMLIVLGARGMRDAAQGGRDGATGLHRHGPALPHQHAGNSDHVHVGAWTLARRPLLVGVLHGLAGSGGLTTLVLARTATLGGGMAEIVVFALGALVGMAALSAAAGWPVAQLASRPGARRILVGGTGAFSLGLGAWWGLPLTLRLLAG